MTRARPLPIALAAVVLLVGGAGCSAGPIEIATLPPAQIASGLLGHWTFDDGVGAVVQDSSGNERDGLVFGPGWSWTAGRFGGALSFGGADQVTVAGFPQATSNFTISAWLRVENSGTEPDIAAVLSTEILGGLGSPISSGGWSFNVMLRPLDSQYHFAYWTGYPVDLMIARCRCVVAQEWVHFAAVVESGEDSLVVYVNGLETARAPIAGPIMRGSGTLFMGHWPQSERFLVGSIDDVSIYARALVPAEIAFLAAAPALDPI